jgi:hypothetical protein
MIPDTDIKGMGWDKIVRRLHVVASRLNGLFGEPSADDLVQSVLLDFFASDVHLGFDPRLIADGVSLEDGLTFFLMSILRRRAIDEFRRRKRFTSLSRMDEHRKRAYIRFDLDVELSELQNQMIGVVQNDVIAQKLILAASEITGSGKIDQELAEMVFGDPGAAEKIVNAKKRIRRAISRRSQAKMLLEGRQKDNNPWSAM